MRRTPHQLPLDHSFTGPGVYALFYDGELPIYQTVRSSDATSPIYVGKAVPPGARKGLAKIGQEKSLYNRLKEHTESIRATKTLRIEDFRCRYLVVRPLWITMAERFLIEHYKPVWNVVLDGFGNHDPGSGRYQGEITWWDALHPGRAWAARLQQTRNKKAAERLLREYFENKVAPTIPAEDDEAQERESVED